MLRTDSLKEFYRYMDNAEQELFVRKNRIYDAAGNVLAVYNKRRQDNG